MKRALTMSVLVGAWVLTTGCQPSDLSVFNSYSPKPLSASTGVQPPRVTLGQLNRYFVQANKRDPFRGKPHTSSVCVDCKKKKDKLGWIDAKRAPKSRLETYELDQLRVTAIVASTSRPAAIVKDPSGWGFVVRQGMAIGKHGGYIRSIRHDGLIIEQTDRNVMHSTRVVSRVKLPLVDDVRGSRGTGFVRFNGKSYKVNEGGKFLQALPETRRVR